VGPDRPHRFPSCPTGNAPTRSLPRTGASTTPSTRTACKLLPHDVPPGGPLRPGAAHRPAPTPPVGLHWSVRPYLEEVRGPPCLGPAEQAFTRPVERHPLVSLEAARYAATFGVSCEACHLGAKAHAESRRPPRFFPAVRTVPRRPAAARRPHPRQRPLGLRALPHGKPAGVRRRDVHLELGGVQRRRCARGAVTRSCGCIDCHDPHRALGPRWGRARPTRTTPVCLKCHEQLRPALRRQQHTHHPAGSPGARCLNCHMPRLNEGVQEVVRTHMIYSPTRADMIEANQPQRLQPLPPRPAHRLDATAPERVVRGPHRRGQDRGRLPRPGRPGGSGLAAKRQPGRATRGREALARTGDARELPRLLDALDDPHLLNPPVRVPGDSGGAEGAPPGRRLQVLHDGEERRKGLAELRLWVNHGRPGRPAADVLGTGGEPDGSPGRGGAPRRLPDSRPGLAS